MSYVESVPQTLLNPSCPIQRNRCWLYNPKNEKYLSYIIDLTPTDKMTTRPTKTITIEVPLEFAEVTKWFDYAQSLMYAYCGRCGDDINGHITKFAGERYHNVESDHWKCQGCEMSYCDECVRKTTAENDYRPEGLRCQYCAEEKSGFQRCDGESCEHYRWGDDGNWNCHEGLDDKVLCPDCDGKLTDEQKVKCADAGCDVCDEKTK